jgi:hypothetical protein
VEVSNIIKENQQISAVSQVWRADRAVLFRKKRQPIIYLFFCDLNAGIARRRRVFIAIHGLPSADRVADRRGIRIVFLRYPVLEIPQVLVVFHWRNDNLVAAIFGSSRFHEFFPVFLCWRVASSMRASFVRSSFFTLYRASSAARTKIRRPRLLD